VATGIRVIVHSETITMIPIDNSTLLLTAFRLRSMLSDFIDCLILASAINHCDALVTEDDDIKDLKNDAGFKSLCTGTNPRFGIQTLIETI